jgi:hypothetical protein
MVLIGRSHVGQMGSAMSAYITAPQQSVLTVARATGVSGSSFTRTDHCALVIVGRASQ